MSRQFKKKSSHSFPFLPEPRMHACSVDSAMFHSFQAPGLWLTRFPCPWDSPGKDTGVGCHALFQKVFLTPGSNQHLLHCRRLLDPLSHVGSPSSTTCELPQISLRGCLSITLEILSTLSSGEKKDNSSKLGLLT